MLININNLDIIELSLCQITYYSIVIYFIEALLVLWRKNAAIIEGKVWLVWIHTNITDSEWDGYMWTIFE